MLRSKSINAWRLLPLNVFAQTIPVRFQKKNESSQKLKWKWGKEQTKYRTNWHKLASRKISMQEITSDSNLTAMPCSCQPQYIQTQELERKASMQNAAKSSPSRRGRRGYVIFKCAAANRELCSKRSNFISN